MGSKYHEGFCELQAISNIESTVTLNAVLAKTDTLSLVTDGLYYHNDDTGTLDRSSSECIVIITSSDEVNTKAQAALPKIGSPRASQRYHIRTS